MTSTRTRLRRLEERVRWIEKESEAIPSYKITHCSESGHSPLSQIITKLCEVCGVTIVAPYVTTADLVKKDD